MTEQKSRFSSLEGEPFEAMSTVVGQVAHDFNNLLTPLLAYPQLIKTDLPEGAYGVNLLDVMEKTAKDMVHITKQLLELTSKQRSGKELADIGPIIERAADNIRLSCLREGIELEVTIDPDLPTVCVMAERLVDAIYNIAVNGVEAMGAQGKLVIHACLSHEEDGVAACGIKIHRGRYLKISIADNGPGIPDDIGARVFEPFVTTKKAAGRRGAGLGLSVVYRIIRDHSGVVDFICKPGEGTVFSILLPLDEVACDELADITAANGVAAVELQPCDNSRVLVVDDEKTILKLFQMILSHGLPDRKIDQANNGAEALEAFGSGHHGVILMDLHMPVMDGQAAFIAVEKMCKARHWMVPSVVFCTGFAPPDTVRRIVTGNPYHGLLSKPVGSEILIETVKSRLVK